MRAPYGILAFPKTVNLSREFRGGLPDGSFTKKFDHASSVPALLHQLYLEPLEERRRISRLTFLYKVLHEHVAVSPDHLNLILAERPVRGTVTKQRLKILRFSTTQFQKSFVPRTITQWNTLPDRGVTKHRTGRNILHWISSKSNKMQVRNAWKL